MLTLPTSKAAHNYLVAAERAIENGEFEKALKYYDLAIKEEAKCIESYQDRDGLLVKLKKYNNAIKVHEEGLKIGDKDIFLYFKRC